MNGALWTPANAQTLPKRTVPEGDFRLGTIAMKDTGADELTGGRFWVSERRWKISVCASMDPTPNHGPLLHVSIACVSRDPSWAEIRAAKDYFYGDSVDAMMVIPRAFDYVNLHPHAFHLWQTPEGWGLQ